MPRYLADESIQVLSWHHLRIKQQDTLSRLTIIDGDRTRHTNRDYKCLHIYQVSLTQHNYFKTALDYSQMNAWMTFGNIAQNN